MDADTEKGQTDLGCGHKILVEIGLSFFLWEGGGGVEGGMCIRSSQIFIMAT